MDLKLNSCAADDDALSPRNLGRAALVLGAMLLLVFWDVMILGDARVLSKVGCDVYSGALAGREFGFGQLRQGNFALWCPSILCGCPFFGGFQSGLVYPLSFPYLFLSAVAGINWSFILHTFLGGMFMYLWLGRQSLHRHACLAGALMFAFCAPFYLRLYAGHLMPHSTITWIPLVFLAIDGLIAAPTLGWLLLGTTAVSMELLGGYPQVLFYTAIAAGFYTLAKLSAAPKLWKSLLLLALMNVFTLGLTCVQWATSMAMAEECVRKGGVSYEFAAMFSLPPENWLTLIRPGLFGDMEAFPYWGRCYLWEMCLYFGIIGLFFAVVGLWHAQRRRVLTVAGIGVILGVLAMGCHSPHFRFFYEHVPGFNMFRSNSKFIIPLVVFLIFLGAHGLDALFRREKRVAPLLIGSAAFSLVLAVAYWTVLYGPIRIFYAFMQIPLKSDEAYDADKFAALPDAVEAAADFAAVELRLALMFMVILTLLLYFAWKRPAWHRAVMTGVLVVIGCELFFFAKSEHVFYSPAKFAVAPGLRSFLEKNCGEGRMLSLSDANLAMSLQGVSDLWGYNPDGVIRRYAEFMAFTQGGNPDRVTGYQTITKMHPRFDLLRCKFIVTYKKGEADIGKFAEPLPKNLLVTEWRVLEKRDAIFAAISRAGFDPRHTVYLERPLGSASAFASANLPAKARDNKLGAAPGIPDLQVRSEPRPARQPGDAPGAGASDSVSEPGSIRILRESTDWQEVEVTVTQPAILVQTDLYTPNWHAYALPGSAQSAYELIPANYILRAVPLQAGTHRLRIEYRPTKFVIGKWVSLASLALFVALVGWWIGRKLSVGGTRGQAF